MRTTQRIQDSRSQQIRDELAINVDELRTSKEFSNAIARAIHNLSDLRKYPWDMRFECLKIIEKICEQHLVSGSATREACVEAFMDSNNVRGICHAISEQLRDNRSEISKGWSQTLCALATSLGPKFSKHLKALLPPLLSHLGSGNELIRIYLDTAILTLLTHVPSAAAIKEIYAAFTYNRSNVVKELCLNYVLAIVSVWNGNRYRETHLKRLEEMISKGLICKTAVGRKLAAKCFLEYVEKFPSKREPLLSRFPKRVQSFIDSVATANDHGESESSSMLTPDKFYRNHRVLRSVSNTPSPVQSGKNLHQKSRSSRPPKTLRKSSEGSQPESSASSHPSPSSTPKIPRSIPSHPKSKRRSGKKTKRNIIESLTPKSEHLYKYLKRKSPLKHLTIKPVVESRDVVEGLDNWHAEGILNIPAQMPVKNLKAGIKELLKLELSMARKKKNGQCAGDKESRKGTRMNKVDYVLFEHEFYIQQLERVLEKSNQLRESLATDGEEDVWEIVNRVLKISPRREAVKKSPRKKLWENGSPRSRVACLSKAISSSSEGSQMLNEGNQNWDIEEQNVEKYLNQIEGTLLKKHGSLATRMDKGIRSGSRTPTSAAVMKDSREDVNNQQLNQAGKGKKVWGPTLKKHLDEKQCSPTNNLEDVTKAFSPKKCAYPNKDLNSNTNAKPSPESFSQVNNMPDTAQESSSYAILECPAERALTQDVKSVKSELGTIVDSLETGSNRQAKVGKGDNTPITTSRRQRKRRAGVKTQRLTPDYKRKNRGSLEAEERRTWSQPRMNVWANLAEGRSSIGSFPKAELKGNVKLTRINNGDEPARTKKSNFGRTCKKNLPTKRTRKDKTKAETPHFGIFKTGINLDPETTEIINSFLSETKPKVKNMIEKICRSSLDMSQGYINETKTLETGKKTSNRHGGSQNLPSSLSAEVDGQNGSKRNSAGKTQRD